MINCYHHGIAEQRWRRHSTVTEEGAAALVRCHFGVAKINRNDCWVAFLLLVGPVLTGVARQFEANDDVVVVHVTDGYIVVQVLEEAMAECLHC